MVVGLGAHASVLAMLEALSEEDSLAVNTQAQHLNDRTTKPVASARDCEPDVKAECHQVGNTLGRATQAQDSVTAW